MSATNLDPKGLLPLGHTFDVDPRSGFMPPTPPIPRLPPTWEIWESTLDSAMEARLQLGDKPGLTSEEAATSKRWREQVRQIPILPIDGLVHSPILLRRAHVVLAFMLHFYIQSLPPKSPVNIPRPLSLPLLRVSQALDIPPLLTYADTGLYNWAFRTTTTATTPSRPAPAESEHGAVNSNGNENPSEAEMITTTAVTPPNQIPTIDNIRTQVMFTNLTDEEEFYLCASRIELRGVEILELMRQTMDETFLGDAIAVQRITSYLDRIAQVIVELRVLLLDVKQKCDPDVYYNQVRPWFRGEDSLENPRKWVYEGLDDELEAATTARPRLAHPTELSGPSAGQSSMIHVIDIFLNVDHQPTSPNKPSFMSRMQTYMPRNHRLFLDHLKQNPRPLRQFVLSQKHSEESHGGELLEAYNRAVKALKEFRDAHMIIAALYIIGPARRAAKQRQGLDEEAGVAAAGGAPGAGGRGGGVLEEAVSKRRNEPSEAARLKGTGGTNLVKFLKDTRLRTTETLIPEA